MSNELNLNFPGDYTLYALLLNSVSNIYNTSSQAFETPQDANWANYVITLTETGNTEFYRGDMPGVGGGIYSYVVREREGVSPAVTDPHVGWGQINWDGSAEIPINTVPWNSAWDAEVQSECADALTAYDPSTKAEMDTAHDLLATEAKQDIIDSNVDAILLDTGTDGVVVAAASKTGYQLSAAGIDGVLDEVIEGTYTMRQMLRLMAAVLIGESSGGGTATITFRDTGDGTNRVVATVSAAGNRTAVTLDAT